MSLSLWTVTAVHVAVVIDGIHLCTNFQASSDGLYVRRSPSVPAVSDIEQWRVDVKRRSVVIVSLVFTALHVMQTRYCDEISVRPSVRLSHACIVTKR